MTGFGQIRRRRLVAIATSEFKHYEKLDEVPDEVSRITAWLTDEKLGDRTFTPEYEELATGPLRAQIEARFRDAPDEEQWNSGDAAVVYITGHGVVEKEGNHLRHFLVLKNTNVGTDISRTALPTSDLLRWLATTTIEYLLVIIDVCFAGHAVDEIMDVVKDRWLILPSALNDQRAKQGALADAIGMYFDKAAQFNTHSRFLTVGLFVYTLNQMLETIAPGQRIEEIYKGGRSWKTRDPRSARDTHVCLPNPAFDPQDERVETDAARQALALPADLLSIHNRVNGQQPSAGSPGWLFTGRQRLMRDLIEAAGQPGITMVTGSAGSGKSTALSRLVTLSDPKFRSRHRRELRGVPKDLRPPRGAVDVAVSARGRSTRHVLTQICVDLASLGNVTSLDDTVAANRQALSEYLARSPVPVTIVIDALDEADNPVGLVTTVLRPLSQEHPKGLRLLVGVRSPAEEAIVGTAAKSGEESLTELIAALGARRIPADDNERWSQDDLIRFVGNVLTNTVGNEFTNAGESPYKNAGPETVPRIAEVISGFAGRSYLTAWVAADSLAKERSIVAADDPGWIADLKEGLLGVFRRDVQSTLGTPDRWRWGVALLRAVAFARGNGLPRFMVWPAVAKAVGDVEGAGYSYGDGDVTSLLRTRLSAYLMTDEEDQFTVYRLVHDELRDILRYRWRELLTEDGGEAPPRADEAEITAVEARIAWRFRAEIRHTATVAVGQPTPPYIRRHLAEHAVAGDALDDCLPVPFLPYIDLSLLRAAVGASTARQELDQNIPWLPVIQQVAHLWDWYRPAGTPPPLGCGPC